MSSCGRSVATSEGRVPRLTLCRQPQPATRSNARPILPRRWRPLPSLGKLRRGKPSLCRRQHKILSCAPEFAILSFSRRAAAKEDMAGATKLAIHSFLLSPPILARPLQLTILPDQTGRRRRRLMTLAINDIAPDFEAETAEGKIRFHDWIGDKWSG